MDIAVTGRHLSITDRFREHVHERLERLGHHAAGIQRVEVLVSHEPTRSGGPSERVEVTCLGKGPVIRAEARHDDKFSALDLATERLRERLRRASDRRRVHRGRRTPESVGEATHRAGAMAEALAWAQPQPDPERSEEGRFGDSPIEIREKIHRAEPMTLEQALHELELVGHDFFLFVDVETSAPSVVYRRRGWSYGVIRLDDASAGADDEVDVA